MVQRGGRPTSSRRLRRSGQGVDIEASEGSRILMPRGPLVSVVMPLYNAAAHVGQAIASVEVQTMTAWELVVVDDGSTDDGARIVEEIGARDRRIHLIRQERNAGAAVARNIATERARGRYIAFLDADDLWDPTKLERQIEFAEGGGHASTHTWYRRVEPDGTPTGTVRRAPPRLSYRACLRANRIGCLTAMYDAERLGKVYIPAIRKRNDYALWLSLLKRVEHAHCLPTVLASYRAHSGTLSEGKVGLVAHHWRLFRETERLSLAESAFYVAANVAAKLVRG